MAAPPPDHWAAFWASIDALEGALRKSNAVHVNAAALLEMTKLTVQQYFRNLRPELELLRLPLPQIQRLDETMQRLLELSNGRNAKAAYVHTLRGVKRLRPGIELEREMLIGRRAITPNLSHTPPKSGVEEAILKTLAAMLPSAALSYEQTLRDLAQADRASYRGTAAEIREILREVLDHLAPDRDVEKAPGYSPEKGRNRPTMRQKVRFILRSRGVGATAVATPETAIERVDEASGSLARSVYDRGSLAAHVISTRREVQQLKLYADGILAELLEIHR